MTHTFVVAIAKRGRTLPPDVVRRLGGGRPDSLLFDPAADVTWQNPRGTVLVRAWEIPDPAYGITTHWSERDDGFTAFTGYVWSRRTSWAAGTWAERLSELARAASVPDAITQLTGVFSLVTLDRDGQGWLGCDALGFSLLYEADAPDYSVWASRADAAAWAITPAGHDMARDPMGVAWLAYSGYLVGDRTGFTQVRTVPQGVYIDVSSELGAQRRTWSAAPWTTDTEVDAPAEDAALDAVRAEVGEQLRAIARLPATPRTGGSHRGQGFAVLILAVLIDEGLTDAFDFRTMGEETLPDVVFARQLAEHFSLRHQLGSAESVRSPMSHADELRSMVRDSSGMLNLWHEVGVKSADGSLDVNGLFGEVMRTNYPRTGNLTSRRHLARRYRTGWRFGSLGLLQRDVVAQLESVALASMFDDPTGRMTAVDLIDVWYIRNRMRRLFGTAQEMLPGRIYPLYSLTTTRIAFAIGPKRRRVESLHRGIIKAACPELYSWDFAGSGWSDAVATDSVWRQRMRGALPRSFRDAVRGRRASQPPSGEAVRTAAATANQQYQNQSRRQKMQLFEEVLLDDPANPIFDIVDRVRVRNALEHVEELDLRSLIELWGVATGAIWLGRHELAPSRAGA